LKSRKLDGIANDLVAAWYSGVVTNGSKSQLVLYADALMWTAMTYTKPMGRVRRRDRLLGRSAIGMTVDADVVIVGAGIAGALVASRLAAAGVKVTVLEAGPRIDRGKAVIAFYNALVKVPECAYPNTAYAPHPRSDDLDFYYVQTGPEKFSSTYLRQVGGTTWHFLGTFLRLVPDDFRLASRFGRGVDWPIDYPTLEPWYGDAETEVGVAGDSADDLGSPRSKPFPMPPIAMTYLDRQVAAGFAGTPYEVRATPQARNSVVRDNRRRVVETRAASRCARSRPSTTARCTSRRPKPRVRS
jgi:choline dehydrogenase-like flavoprotein